MLNNPSFDLKDLPSYIHFNLYQTKLSETQRWQEAKSKVELHPSLGEIHCLSVYPTGGCWEENSEALGLLISETLQQLHSRRYTTLLYVHGELNNGIGDLVPLLPFIFHGCENGRFYLHEAYNPDNRNGRTISTSIGFEYNQIQFEQLMKRFSATAFRLDTSFGGAIWHNQAVEEGLKFDNNYYSSLPILAECCPMWFETNKDFECWSINTPSLGWRRRMVEVVNNALLNANLRPLTLRG